MRRLAAAAMFAMIATAACSAAAQEGVGDLEACVVEATTADDRRALVRWMFSAISLHPELQDLPQPTGAQREEANRGMGAVMERLLAEDCAEPARRAFRDGSADQAVGNAFRRVGELAGEGLFADPRVAAEASSLIRHVDMNRSVELFLP